MFFSVWLSYCSKCVQQSCPEDCHNTLPKSATEETVIGIKKVMQEHERNGRINEHNHEHQDKDGEQLSSW